MSNRIHFEVLGPPQAQKRHKPHVRAHGKGKYHIHSEDPSESDKADFLALCRDNALDMPIEGAVILRVVFWMPVPKSATKRLKLNVEDFDWTWDISPNKGSDLLSAAIFRDNVLHTKARFDIDNQIKFIMDALAGVYWQNDGQVQVGWAYKIYSHKPRTEIEIIW